MDLVKKVAIGGVVVLVSVGASLTAGTSAQAASTTQRICSSKNSYDYMYVSGTLLEPTDCVTVPRGSQVRLVGPSHRVGYDGGKYSACRVSPTGYFKPYQGANVIYFEVHNQKNCDDIIVTFPKKASKNR